ncbi:hypothetical protein GF345_04180 [Candidatus Woesearchaeota archaeon]|nr:hypothetical protein [Candidatus Woesearchaeota archaeon]
MRMHKNLFNVVAGLACVVVGVFLSIDFILQFALAALGILLIIIGMSLLTKRL